MNQPANVYSVFMLQRLFRWSDIVLCSNTQKVLYSFVCIEWNWYHIVDGIALFQRKMKIRGIR